MQFSYRTLLRRELDRRQKLNPMYSLRAFARDLGITAAQLSPVMNGTKGLSSRSATRVAERLDLGPDETEAFHKSVESLHSRDLKKREKSKLALNRIFKGQQFQTFSESQFSPINEWYFLSILQCFELKDYEPSSQWIAKRLGLSKNEVDQALTLLLGAGLLKKSAHFFKPSHSFIKTQDISSRTIRYYLQQMLKKSSKALESQSIEERDFSSTVFPIDSARVPEFKVKIKEFRESFCQEATSSKAKNEIYNLSVQFFKITH